MSPTGFRLGLATFAMRLRRNGSLGGFVVGVEEAFLVLFTLGAGEDSSKLPAGYLVELDGGAAWRAPPHSDVYPPAP